MNFIIPESQKILRAWTLGASHLLLHSKILDIFLLGLFLKSEVIEFFLQSPSHTLSLSKYQPILNRISLIAIRVL